MLRQLMLSAALLGSLLPLAWWGDPAKGQSPPDSPPPPSIIRVPPKDAKTTPPNPSAGMVSPGVLLPQFGTPSRPSGVPSQMVNPTSNPTNSPTTTSGVAPAAANGSPGSPIAAWPGANPGLVITPAPVLPPVNAPMMPLTPLNPGVNTPGSPIVNGPSSPVAVTPAVNSSTSPVALTGMSLRVQSAGAGTPASITQMPAVQIEKRGPETANVLQPLVYEIIVRNVGPVAVQQVHVDDELPSGVKLINSEPVAEASGEKMAWNVGVLEPGSERKIRVELQPQSECELRGQATVTFSTSAAIKTTVVRPRLAITMTGPENVLSGEQVAFQIQVSNPGTGAVKNLVLRDKLPAGLQHPQGSLIEAELGTLNPGESKNVTLRTIAAAGGQQANEVIATGEGLEVTARAAVTVLEPMLQVKRTGPAKCLFKTEVTEEVEITNQGTAAANNAQANVVLPTGVEFLSASDGANFDAATRSITWKLGAVAPGSKRNLSYRIKAMSVGDLTDRVTASAERVPEVKADGALSVEGVPALSLEVCDLEDPVEVGGDLTYEIRVVNQGSCPCTNIQITATVPEGLTAKESGGPTTGRTASAQVVFDALPKLMPKTDAVYRVKVRCDQPGDYRFKVQMTCEQLRSPVNKEECSRVYKNQ